MRNNRHSFSVRPGARVPVDAARDQSFDRRQLVAGLRDAHAAATTRVAALRHLTGSLSLRSAPGHLLHEIEAEAEEQLRRLEHVFASLREHTGGGDPAAARAELTRLAEAPTRDGRSGPLSDAAILSTLQYDAEWGTEEHEALLRLAHAAGLYLVARLLDLTVQERRARARALAGLLGAPSAAEPPRARGAVH